MVILAVAWPKWEPGTSSVPLPSQQQQRLWCFLLASRETEQQFNQILPPVEATVSKALFPTPPPFSFPSSSKGEKRSPRTRERRAVPILTLQHCPCKPNSRIPGGLGSSCGVVFTGFSGLHQQIFLSLMVFLGHVFTLLIPRSYTGIWE